jgi:hypothetical protein
MKTLFIRHNCCCECGLPIRKIDGQKLHGEGYGRSCSMPTYFRAKLCTSADAAGLQPFERLRQLLSQGDCLHSIVTFPCSFDAAP